MLVRCGLLLLLGLARTTGNIETNGLLLGKDDRSLSFSHWPSFHNGASMWRMRKREIQGELGQSEGGSPIVGQVIPPVPTEKPSPGNVSTLPLLQVSSSATLPEKAKVETPSVDAKVPVNSTQNNTEHSSILAPALHSNDTKNANLTDEQTEKLDLSGPGVVKRGIIVFGGFALLAVAYFIFYRRKTSKNDAGTSHSTIDPNQFRYGVLQSEDRRDNLELSRVPLTMESDEDEDDDLEIFDLEQKRKSMSYVNLQVNDEEIVNGPRDRDENDRDNLLLDIEDVNTDALINWSSNGNKSIL